MDNTYSLNTHPFTGLPMPKKEHRRMMLVLLLCVVVLAVIVGIVYWLAASRTAPTNPVASQSDIRAQVAALLKSTPVRASQTDINNVASLLMKTKTNVTASDRQAVARQLAQ